MRSRHVYRSSVVVFCLGVLPATLWAYGGGSGASEDPFLIYTAPEMNSIGLNPQDWDKHFRLMDDIDLSDCADGPFNLVGLYRTAQDPNEGLEVPFSGVFDGQGHTIANFTYEVTGDEDPADGWVRGIGLFRLVDGNDAEIKDLTLLDPNVVPAPTCALCVANVGTLAGVMKSGRITGCRVVGGCVRADGGAGGLVGWLHRSGSPSISHCSADCEVAPAAERSLVEVENADRSLHWYFGGLLGSNAGTVADCNASGPITGGQYVGGLAGRSSGDVIHCQATGSVSGESHVGGLVGDVYYGTISSSWASGDVTGPGETCADEEPVGATSLGGLAGACFRATVSNCHAIGDVTGDTHVGGLVGGCQDSTVERCYATGMVTATDQQAGGLVGAAGLDTLISECYASTLVFVGWAGGGLVGLNGGRIQTSWAEGQIYGVSGVGGLVGEQWKWLQMVAGYPLEYDGAIMDCYALTSVSCEESEAGGLLGAMEGGTVLRCFAAGTVSGFGDIGGLVGAEHAGYPAQVEQSFWDRDTTGLGISAGGVGLSTPQMQDRAAFVGAGWDLADETENGTDDIWWIPEGQTYPRLWWERLGEATAQ